MIEKRLLAIGYKIVKNLTSIKYYCTLTLLNNQVKSKYSVIKQV